MKIDRTKYEEAYNCARKVQLGQMRVTDAKRHLVKIGINPNSALDFVYIFKHMLRGEIYKRAMSADATEDFILWIRRDYGESAFHNSLSALSQHIPYNRGATKAHRAFLAKYGDAKFSLVEPKTALDDLDEVPPGNASPDRGKRTQTFIERDNKVRSHVVRRANGRCEYCGADGFSLPTGQKYVEAHHVISLAKSGKDTLDNVIALCASHHREAHYGIHAEKLEAEFVRRIAEIRNR